MSIITKYNLDESCVLKDKKTGRRFIFNKDTTFLSYDTDKYIEIKEDNLFNQ